MLNYGLRPRTLEEIHQDYLWESFHQDLLNKGEAVKRVEEVIQYLLDTVNRPDIPSEKHCAFFNDNREITNLQIGRKFQNFCEKKVHCMDSNEADNYSRNLAANMVRGLRLIAENGPVFLLAQQDKIDLSEFINDFSFPPNNYSSRYYSLIQ